MLNIQLWHVRESFEILIEQFSAGTPPGRSQRHLSSGGPVVCIPLPIPSFLTLSPTSPSLASPASRPPPPHAALLSNLLKPSTFFHFSSKLHLISLIAFSCHPHFSTACLGKKKKKTTKLSFIQNFWRDPENVTSNHLPVPKNTISLGTVRACLLTRNLKKKKT